MSKLSELLNPVPVSNAPERLATVATGSPNHDANSRENSNHRDNSPTMVLSRGSPLPSLESPLQALAAAATITAPMRSPTPPQGTSFSSIGPHQSASSRPTSSRISPPLPLELSRQPENPLGAISPGLEQYHHSTSRELKARDLTNDASQTLPPLRSGLRDENKPVDKSPVAMPALNGLSQVKSVPLSPEAQHEEPKQEPNNTQHIKVSSPTPPKPQSPLVDGVELQPAEVEVKAELIDHSSGFLQDTVQHGEAVLSTKSSPQPSDTGMEQALPRNISDLKIDASYLGTEPTRSTSVNPKATPSRKRPAPRSKVEKKGTASTVKPPAKRRKVEAVSVDGTPSVQRSVTPASSRASKTPAPRNRKQESVTPVRSSSVAAPNDEDEEDDEDSELFCICRKPDDHTWMIACDGGCEDWFHGRCVDMNERDGNLIDKYICA